MKKPVSRSLQRSGQQAVEQHQHTPIRYLGLELSGAKNKKTSVAAIEYYPKEKKTFLLDIYDRITSNEDESGDEALLEVLTEIQDGVAQMGVNVPLLLPPCIDCTRKTCPLPKLCTVGAVQWMRNHHSPRPKGRDRVIEGTVITPYTQRPIELWVRFQIFPLLPESLRFDIDETLGGNRAPLTARMHFLKRHLHEFPLIEVWPKLSVAVLSQLAEIPKRLVSSYRQLEEGIHAREEILSLLAQHYELFIYERDLRKLSQSLTAFDAFICAFTALLSDQNLCAKIPKGFPASSGWVEYPRF